MSPGINFEEREPSKCITSSKQLSSAASYFLFLSLVLIAILEKALEVAKKVVVPLNDALFQGTVHHAYMGDLLALVLLLVLCFLAGLAAKTSFARKSVEALEKKVLAKVPTYDSMKSKSLPRCSLSLRKAGR